MSEAEKFTPAEWQTLQFSPFWVFAQVAGIDGKIDDEEQKAFLKELADAPIYKSPLVREVLISVATDMGDLMTAYTADTRKVGVGLADVANALDAKADASEAVMFKAALVGIAMHVAQASGSRWSKDKVSKEEETAISFIGAVLRFDPAEFSRIAPSYQTH